MKIESKVSIIIPVYNGSKYLCEAIGSALSQTYKNIEVIVINDGSTDLGKTRELALSYGDKIRYFEKENGGISTALNLGIEKMTGDYFSWLSHDDVYYNNKIEKQILYLNNSNIKDIILYSDYDVIDDKSKITRTTRIPPIKPKKFQHELILSHPLNGCTALIPKKCFEKVGLFNENLKYTQDYDMWFRLANYYDFIHMNEILTMYREHPEQGSMSLKKEHLKEIDNYYINCLNQIAEEKKWFKIKKNLVFLKFSKSLYLRGYIKPSEYAFKLFKKIF
jgi:glycosyltransferase involved in cell wall biosynthesis